MNLSFIWCLGVFIIPVLAQYVPEPYGWACYRMATKRDWPECKSLPQSKQKECLCNLPEFVQLTENCLKAATSNATDPEKAIERANDLSLCKVCLATSKGSKTNTSIPPNKMKHHSGKVEELPEFAYVDPIDSKEIEIAVSTAEWRMCNDRRAELAGVALVAFWGIVIITKYIAHALRTMLPTNIVQPILLSTAVKLFRSRVLNSPLGRHHHSEPVNRTLGLRLPTRSMSIILILFACLNYALIFTNFPYTERNFIYATSTQQWNKSLAIRCAFMIMWKLPLVFAFAARNNIFLLIFHPWSPETFRVCHKWIARMTIIDIIIHGVAISAVKYEQLLYPSVWQVKYWQWGISGLIAAVLIAMFSVYWISNSHYEVFKVTHVVLIVVFVVSTWYHVQVLPYGTKHAYAILAIWGFDQVARLVRLLLACRVKARLDHMDDSLSIITISDLPWIYRQTKLIDSSHVFLHLPPYYMFWQSHPFTIVRCLNPPTARSLRAKELPIASQNEDKQQRHCSTFCMKSPAECRKYSSIHETLSGSPESIIPGGEQLVIAIKHQQGITKQIANLPEGPINIALDGPYGYISPFNGFNYIVCLAGGVGITAHLNHIQNLLKQESNSPRTIKLFWAISSIKSMEWALDILTQLVPHIEIEVYSSEDAREASRYDGLWPVKLNFCRLNCSDVVKNEVSAVNNLQMPLSMAIFACGPRKFNDDARSISCWAVEHADVFVDFFEESYI